MASGGKGVKKKAPQPPKQKETGSKPKVSNLQTAQKVMAPSPVSPKSASPPALPEQPVRMADETFIANSVIFHNHSYGTSWLNWKDFKLLLSKTDRTVRSVMYPLTSDDLNVGDLSFDRAAVVTFSSKQGNNQNVYLNDQNGKSKLLYSLISAVADVLLEYKGKTIAFPKQVNTEIFTRNLEFLKNKQFLF